MTFKEYLESQGDKRVADMLGVSHFAVRSWRLGTRSPRKEEARKLAAIEPGLTLDVIYAKRTDDKQAAAA